MEAVEVMTEGLPPMFVAQLAGKSQEMMSKAI